MTSTAQESPDHVPHPFADIHPHPFSETANEFRRPMQSEYFDRAKSVQQRILQLRGSL